MGLSGFSILGGLSNSVSINGDLSYDVQEREMEAQRKHAAILARITPEILASDTAVKILRDELLGLAQTYIKDELAYLGVDVPMNLDLTNPDHAIVYATRMDIRDSADRLDQLLKQRSDSRYWTKALNEIGSFEPPKLPGLPQLFSGGVLLIVAGVVILFLVLRK